MKDRGAKGPRDQRTLWRRTEGARDAAGVVVAVLAVAALVGLFAGLNAGTGAIAAGLPRAVLTSTP